MRGGACRRREQPLALWQAGQRDGAVVHGGANQHHTQAGQLEVRAALPRLAEAAAADGAGGRGGGGTSAPELVAGSQLRASLCVRARLCGVSGSK